MCIRDRDYIIRDAKKNDMKSVLQLIQELALFEREPDEVIITEDQLIKDGFSGHPKFKCFVAEIESEVVGIALLYPRYSTWKGHAMHLEDLIVTEKHRGKGIGFALFSKFIKYSHDLNVKRVQWVVLDWNTSAIDFYKKNGAIILDDWRVALMDDKAIQKFVKNEGI